MSQDVQHSSKIPDGKYDSFKTILMILWGMFQALLVPLFLWGASTINSVDRSLAGLKPVIDQLESSASQIVGRAAYERDQAKHEQEHQRINLQINDVAARLQELRIDVTKWSMRIEDLARTDKPKI